MMKIAIMLMYHNFPRSLSFNILLVIIQIIVSIIHTYPDNYHSNILFPVYCSITDKSCKSICK